MKALLDMALAALRWGWETLGAFAKIGWAKLRILFDTVYDPPPRTIRFWFWSAFGLVACVWITFAFVNSWFYRPTIQALAEFSYTLSGDDGDVALPETEPVSPVAVTSLPPVEVVTVCHDMSDTPHCEPVKDLTPEVKKEVSEIPPPVAKPKATVKKRLTVRRQHQPYQTYWGF